MPPTCQLLYYHLGMSADDDGFVEWYTVVTMTRSSEEDLRNLAGNQFVKIFDDQVLVILDWKENNYLQSDRYTRSKYLDVYNMDTDCIQSVYTGKDRLGKVSKEIETEELSVIETNTKTKQSTKQTKNKIDSALHLEYQAWITSYNTLYKQRYGVDSGNLKNFQHWREAYSLEDMTAALKNLPKHSWLKDKHTPTLILRQTDRSGQPSDRIGELLSYRVKLLREMMEEQA